MALTGHFRTVKLQRSDNEDNTFEVWQQYPEHDNDTDNHQELLTLLRRLKQEMQDRS